MGQHKDKLINKRSNRRWFGGLLLGVGVSGILFTLYLGASVVIEARRRAEELLPFDDYTSPLDSPKAILFWLCVLLAFLGCLGAGLVVLKKGHNITLELKQTDAEINRQLRVEEGLREQRRSHA
jgi:hypothetical protein